MGNNNGFKSLLVAVNTGFKHVSSAVKQGHEFLTLFMVEQVQAKMSESIGNQGIMDA